MKIWKQGKKPIANGLISVEIGNRTRLFLSVHGFYATKTGIRELKADFIKPVKTSQIVNYFKTQ